MTENTEKELYTWRVFRCGFRVEEIEASDIVTAEKMAVELFYKERTSALPISDTFMREPGRLFLGWDQPPIMAADYLSIHRVEKRVGDQNGECCCALCNCVVDKKEPIWVALDIGEGPMGAGVCRSCSFGLQIWVPDPDAETPNEELDYLYPGTREQLDKFTEEQADGVVTSGQALAEGGIVEIYSEVRVMQIGRSQKGLTFASPGVTLKSDEVRIFAATLLSWLAFAEEDLRGMGKLTAVKDETKPEATH